ncbi:MAG TPA: hypothetical protein VNO26_00155, partial [Candidatus Limnocylindria bacterium]|nr:hypothetical protein [Candidatus Limnocylindria bacterium]
MRRAGTIVAMLLLARPALAERAECLVRFAVAGATGSPDALTLECRDGDAACDADATMDGDCEIAVALCGGPAPCDKTVPPRVRVRGKGTEALALATAAAAATAASCSEPATVVVARGQ